MRVHCGEVRVGCDNRSRNPRGHAYVTHKHTHTAGSGKSPPVVTCFLQQGCTTLPNSTSNCGAGVQVLEGRFSSNPPHACSGVSALGRQRQADPWGSVFRWTSLISELQANGKTCLRKTRWTGFRGTTCKVVLWLPHALIHTRAHIHSEHAHTHTHRYAHTQTHTL